MMESYQNKDGISDTRVTSQKDALFMEIVIILSTIVKLSKKIFQYGTALILPESLVQDDYRIKKLYFDS